LTAERPGEEDAPLTPLRHALQGLALPAERQLLILPDFVPELDELALAFEHGLRVALADSRVRLSAARRRALAEVERVLDRMSGQANAHLWTRSGGCRGEAWSSLRAAARAALLAFGWRDDAPPGRLFEYIEW